MILVGAASREENCTSNPRLPNNCNHWVSRAVPPGNYSELAVNDKVLFWLATAAGEKKMSLQAVNIARKLKVSHPTASEHLKILAQSGLVRSKKIKQWTFYKRNDARIAALKRSIFDRI